MKWAHMPKYQNKKAIICDGSVRSGKTVSMIIGFVHWAMRFFDNCNFGICGKTVGSTYRNIITPLLAMPDITDYYKVSYRRSDSLLTIRSGEKVNRFYVFGGKDESSYTLIQGITLSGVLFDEVALMPKSFVDQAIARTLSEPLARYWFNCNPDSSEHWFYKEWICNTRGKKALHIHFTMQDNPILTENEIANAETLYTGVFYERYILGLWVLAEGLVYQQFDKTKHVIHNYKPSRNAIYYISVDYGTVNPTSMGLWALEADKAVRIKEAYYNSRGTGQRHTDEQHYSMLEQLAKDYPIQQVLVDPSAASFIECIRSHRTFSVRSANNSVIDGVRVTGSLLEQGRLLFSDTCKDSIREFGLYRWDETKAEDTVIKENDHAMDDIRYFCYTILKVQKWKDDTRR